VVVVGAGVSGLLTAALLQKRGIHVLIVDPGGTPGAPSRKTHRQEYTFVSGPSLFLGFERDGLYDRLFHEMGQSLALLTQTEKRIASAGTDDVPRPVSTRKGEQPLIRRPSLFLQLILPNHRVNLFNSQNDLLEEIHREFPDQMPKLEELGRELERWDQRFYPYRLQPLFPSRPGRPIQKWIRDLDRTVAAFAHRHRHAVSYLKLLDLDQGLLDLIEHLSWFCSGRPLAALNGFDFIQCFGLLKRGPVEWVGGIPHFAEFLAGLFTDLKGGIVWNETVVEIHDRSRRVIGLKTGSGETISCKAVIYNLPVSQLEPVRFHGSAFYFGIDEEALPVAMDSHLWFTDGRDRLMVSVSRKEDRWAAPDGCRAVRVVRPTTGAAGGADPAEEGRWVKERLLDLMPFAEDRLVDLGPEDSETDTPPVPAGILPFVEQARPFVGRRTDLYRTALRHLYIQPAGWTGLLELPHQGYSAWTTAQQILKAAAAGW
jgi:phytoene dehydrogenase-like protein